MEPFKSNAVFLLKMSFTTDFIFFTCSTILGQSQCQHRDKFRHF